MNNRKAFQNKFARYEEGFSLLCPTKESQRLEFRYIVAALGIFSLTFWECSVIVLYIKPESNAATMVLVSSPHNGCDVFVLKFHFDRMNGAVVYANLNIYRPTR